MGDSLLPQTHTGRSLFVLVCIKASRHEILKAERYLGHYLHYLPRASFLPSQSFGSYPLALRLTAPPTRVVAMILLRRVPTCRS